MGVAGAQVDLAGREALAVVAVDERVGLLVDLRAEDQVGRGADHEQIGLFIGEAAAARGADPGAEQAGGPVSGRIGVPEHRQIEDRHTQHVDARVAVVDDVTDLVLDHAVGADRPGRRLGRVADADRAGCVDRLVQLFDVFVAAHDAGAGDDDVVGDALLVLARREGERDAGLHLVVQDQFVGVFDRAVVVHHLDVAVGADDALRRRVLVLAARRALAVGRQRALVVDQPVGAQGLVLVADLDVALGGGDPVLVVVNELVGLHVEFARLQAVGMDRRGRLGRLDRLGRFVEDLSALVAPDASGRAPGPRDLGKRDRRPEGHDRRAGEKCALAEYGRHAPARTHLQLPILPKARPIRLHSRAGGRFNRLRCSKAG